MDDLLQKDRIEGESGSDNEQLNLDDVIVEHISPEDAELYEDQLAETDDVSEDTSKIQPSKVIDSLPDVSVSTGTEATDSLTSVDVYKVSNEIVVIAAGSCDEKCNLYMYNVVTHQLTFMQSLSDFSDSVVHVAFAHDGKYLAAASYDATVKVYSLCLENIGNASAPKFNLASLLHTLEGPSIDIDWLQWHPKGYALIAGSKDSTAWMWWAVTGAVMCVLSGHSSPVTCGTFAHQGKLICTCSADGTLIVWNPKTGEKVHIIIGQNVGRSQKPSQDAGMQVAHFHTEPITCIAAHHDLPLVATGSEDSTIWLTNVETGRVVGVLRGHTDSVETLSFVNVPDSENPVLLMSGSLDGSINIWDCSRLTSKLRMKHHEISPMQQQQQQQQPDDILVGGITKLCWCLRHQFPLLLSASTDCTIRVWDIRSGLCLKILSGHRDSVLDIVCLNVDDDKVVVVSGSDDTSLKVWEL